MKSISRLPQSCRVGIRTGTGDGGAGARYRILEHGNAKMRRRGPAARRSCMYTCLFCDAG